MADSLNLQQVQIAVHHCGLLGISEATIIHALSCDLPAMEQLSNELIKHVGNAVVGFLIAEMIKQCAVGKVTPPLALARLVGKQLGAPEYGSTHLRGASALNRAALYKIAHPDASLGEIARDAGIAHSAVSRWNKLGVLDQAKAEQEIILKNTLTPRDDRARADGLDLRPLAEAALSCIAYLEKVNQGRL